MEGLNIEKPYTDPQLEALFERINPARVSVDNDDCKKCTVVKIDSANKHGILLEMVQVLSDLDLLIPKSFICSDGEWFLDVFHVTDQKGNKITDKSVILNIQEGLCATRRKSKEAQQNCQERDAKPSQVSTKGSTALEITAFDKPGLLSKISAALAELGCHVTYAVAWTHNSRAALIIYMEEMVCLNNIQEKIQNVLKAHHEIGEKWSVKLITPEAKEMHTERRLHQLMFFGYMDYETCRNCGGKFNEHKGGLHRKNCDCTLVSIETCKERDYTVVNVRSKDRPKLLFDTVCALTDMDYDVFHAAIRSDLSIAFQEYYIRHREGYILSSEEMRHKAIHCLIAAMERRTSQGLQLDISATDRRGLLSDVTRLFGECGLSVSKAEVSVKGEQATGRFYVRDSSGVNVDWLEVINVMKKELDVTVQVAAKLPEMSSTTPKPKLSLSRSGKSNRVEEKIPLLNIGNLIWSQIESLSNSFIPIKL